MTDADLVMAAVNREPDPTARAELAEALGLTTYDGADTRRTHGSTRTPAVRVGLLDQETP